MIFTCAMLILSIYRNIHITELNPQYIWGGDAITLAGTDLVWIDHVKVREMFSHLQVSLYLATAPSSSEKTQLTLHPPNPNRSPKSAANTS